MGWSQIFCYSVVHTYFICNTPVHYTYTVRICLLLLLLRYRVDHTYKFYYGGAQKRPDAPYMRPVLTPDGKVIAHVGEGNRKDVRNAVEAAHKAAPGSVSSHQLV